MPIWKPMHGTITVFPVPRPIGPAPQDVYKALWGVDPDSFNRVSGSPGTGNASGQIKNFTATCVMSPGRMDINLGPSNRGMVPGTFPLVSDSEGLAAELSEIAKKIGAGKIGFDAVRLACVRKYASKAKSLPEANDAIETVLPAGCKMDLNNKTDFQLQLNTPLRQQNPPMNIVMKWEVETFQLFTLSIPVAGPAEPFTPTSPPASAEYMASVSIDVNNAPSQTGLSAADQGRLLQMEIELEAKRRQELNLVLEANNV